MKQLIFLPALLLGVYSHIYSQADGSFYTFQLGKQTCLFKYEERSATSKSLTLQDDADKAIAIKHPWRTDTIMAINPATNKAEQKIMTTTTLAYHFETEMSYFDFLLLLKSKFELRNPQRNFRVYSFSIYYETPDTGGFIRVKYPDTIDGVISKLNSLDKGGFILLSLRAADHDLVNIDTQGRFLALIHIKKE